MSYLETRALIFIAGIAAGTVTTYFVVTYEKRMIREVRRQINFLGLYHDLPPALYRETIYPVAGINDEQILAALNWAKKILAQRPKILVSPIQLAAEVVICETWMGLTALDASRALASAHGDYESLKSLKRKFNQRS